MTPLKKGKPEYPSILQKKISSLTEAIFYAALGVVSFVAVIAIVYLIINHGTYLVSLGLINKFYFILLLSMGLCSSIFLFGTMKSYAIIRHKEIDTRALVGGPAALFLIVAFGGYRLINSSSPFSVTISVIDKSTRMPVKSGVLYYRYGNIYTGDDINNGKVTIASIAGEYRGTEIIFSLDKPGYRLVGSDTCRLTEQRIDLVVGKEVKNVRIFGEIHSFTKPGNAIAGVLVEVEGHTVWTDSAGAFEINIPDSMNRGSYEVRYSKPGYKSDKGEFILGSRPPVLPMEEN